MIHYAIAALLCDHATVGSIYHTPKNKAANCHSGNCSSEYKTPMGNSEVPGMQHVAVFGKCLCHSLCRWQIF